jgi:sec-independent protein translocase protein TatC
MSLGDHLEELRARLILAISGLAVAAIVSCFFGNYFIQILMKPYEQAVRSEGLTPSIQAITVAEPMMLYIKAVIVMGAILSSPWLFYQFWSFIAAGLYKHERKFIYTVVPFSAGLFTVGTLFFLFFIAPMTMRFFITFNLGIPYLKYNPQITDYVNLMLIMALLFGLSFQLPLIIIFLVKLGLVGLETLKKIRKYVLLGVFIVAAAVTPSSDMISQIALAVPLYILYEGSLLYCSIPKRTPKASTSQTEMTQK